MNDGSEFILASGSPRRRDLLAGAGYRFRVVPPEVEEVPHEGESPVEMVLRLSLEKALAVAAQVTSEAVVLGVDTTVSVDGVPVGKPTSVADSVEMLLSIAGRAHVVYSGYALVFSDGSPPLTGVAESIVTLRSITRSEAVAYAESGEPLDKAGAYAAQGDGGKFVESISGSFTNVMGLPMETVEPALNAAGIYPQ